MYVEAGVCVGVGCCFVNQTFERTEPGTGGGRSNLGHDQPGCVGAQIRLLNRRSDKIRVSGKKPAVNDCGATEKEDSL